MKHKHIEIIDVGLHVECDWCSDIFEASGDRSGATGGLLFQSKAVCPTCVPKVEGLARRYGETHFIRARCPEGMTFRDWVLQLRGGNNKIRIITESDQP